MTLSAGSSLEFNRDRDAGGGARSQAEGQPESKPVADSEHNRVRYRPGKQPQGAVLAAQQIVCQIETPQHIQTGARNADYRNRMMIHSMIVNVLLDLDILARQLWGRLVTCGPISNRPCSVSAPARTLIAVSWHKLLHTRSEVGSFSPATWCAMAV